MIASFLVDSIDGSSIHLIGTAHVNCNLAVMANACLQCPKETRERHGNAALVAEEEGKKRLEVNPGTEVTLEVFSPVLQEKDREVLLEKAPGGAR